MPPLIGWTRRAFFRLNQGGVACIDFEGADTAARSQLFDFINPALPFALQFHFENLSGMAALKTRQYRAQRQYFTRSERVAGAVVIRGIGMAAQRDEPEATEQNLAQAHVHRMR